MKQTDLFEKIIVDNFAGGGGLWCTHHTEAVCAGSPVRRQAHCLAGAHPRTQEQPGGAGREAEALAECGGDH